MNSALSKWISSAIAGFATVAALGTSATALAQSRGNYGIDPRAEERSYFFEAAGKDMPYCVYASSRIEPGTPAPLVIGLHGAGTGPQIMCNSDIVDLVEAGGYVLAAPMGYNERGGYGAPRRAGRDPRPDEPANISELSEQDVMNVLQMMLDEYDIDRNRIYLTGHSMGGGGTMYLGPKHAEIWAAIAPIAGGGGRPDQTESLQRLKDEGVGLIVVHGEADDISPVENSRNLAAEARAIGLDSEYVELPGIGHGPVINLAQEHIFEFFASHSR